MDFDHSEKTQELLDRVRAFMAEHVEPNEMVYYEQLDSGETRWQTPPIMEELKVKAKVEGLWNLFLPASDLGAGLTNLEYAPLCEVMGRSIGRLRYSTVLLRIRVTWKRLNVTVRRSKKNSG